ncbi:ribonuclease H-like domain-containing protein, partial [Tanacetum coccineum]
SLSLILVSLRGWIRSSNLGYCLDCVLCNTTLSLSLHFNFLEESPGGSGSTKNVIDVNDPLYLHSDDTNGTPLIGLKLTGTENYKVWAAASKHCIHSKNKLGFINVFSSNAKLMWDELAETYDKIDGSLNYLWRKYDAMVQLPVCTCDEASSYKDHVQLLKLMQFVMGLNDVYAVGI